MRKIYTEVFALSEHVGSAQQDYDAEAVRLALPLIGGEIAAPEAFAHFTRCLFGQEDDLAGWTWGHPLRGAPTSPQRPAPLTWVALRYVGRRSYNNGWFRVHRGEQVEVFLERRAQLLADFPEAFQAVEDAAMLEGCESMGAQGGA